MRIAIILLAGASCPPLRADTPYVTDATGNAAGDGRCAAWAGGTRGRSQAPKRPKRPPRSGSPRQGLGQRRAGREVKP